MSRVTVLIPNYNRSVTLDQCLRSVIAQSYTDWTVVVGDNASTDDSVALVERIADRRIRLVRRPRTIGWVANLNLLLGEVSGSEYIAVLHSDDWWEPDFLATTVRLLEANPRSLIASTAVRRLGADGRIEIGGLHRFLAASSNSTRSSIDAVRALAGGCRIFTPGVLSRAELHARLGGYEETLPQACDWLMWLRAAAVATVEISSEPLATYRIHEQSLTAQLNRANLRGLDLVRMLLILKAEWRDCEPYPGAITALASAIMADLLADAGQRAECGDREGMLVAARLARLAAPSAWQAAFCSVVLGLLALTGLRALRSGQAGILRIGRAAWHQSQRDQGSRAA